MLLSKKIGITMIAAVLLGTTSLSIAALNGPTVGTTLGNVTYTPDSIEALYSPIAPGSIGNVFWTATSDININVSFDYLIQVDNPVNNITLNNDFTFSYENSLSFTDGLTHHFSDSLSLVANENFFLHAAAGDGPGSRVYISNISVTPVPEPESYAMLLAGLGLLGLWARVKR